MHEISTSEPVMRRNINHGGGEAESSKKEQDSLCCLSLPTLVSRTDLAAEDTSREGPGQRSIMSMLWKPGIPSARAN